MKQTRGFALITVLLMMVVLAAMASAYFMLTQIEMGSVQATVNNTTGFYAAEAGLNQRAAELGRKFVNYSRPAGVGPSTTSSTSPCQGSNIGSGDFKCNNSLVLQGRMVNTYVVEGQNNPTTIKIPPDEQFANLNAIEYRYTVDSKAISAEGKTEALLQMNFRSRLVPMFQFAAFYNDDLEIAPSPAMRLEGPVHTNGDLYLNKASNVGALDITGQVTTAGSLYKGRKFGNFCDNNSVRVSDLSNQREIPTCSGGRTLINQTQLGLWNDQIKTVVETVTVPEPDSFAPQPGREYWDNADLRIVLRLTAAGAPAAIEVRDASNNVMTSATNWISSATSLCNLGNLVTTPITTPSGTVNSVVGTTNSLFNNRENKAMRMLEIDVRGLMECIRRRTLAGQTDLGRLDDETHGGLVWYFTVLGPASTTQGNNYGVRLRNGNEFFGPVRGLTVVSDQAMYIQGDYNNNNWKPASFLVDSLNVLSNIWRNDREGTNSGCTTATPCQRGAKPPATTTNINAAFLSGTDWTCNANRNGGCSDTNSNRYNGGLENYPRFHENWTNQALNYSGSFVSLGRPLRTDPNRTWNNSVYDPPIRNWFYDTRFNDINNLPPLAPRFVYLKQDLFMRDFDQ